MKFTRILGTLETARQWVKIPLPPELGKDRVELTNKRILAKLRKLGVASQAEVKLLQSRVDRLEAEIKKLRSHFEP